MKVFILSLFLEYIYILPLLVTYKSQKSEYIIITFCTKSMGLNKSILRRYYQSAVDYILHIFLQ